VRNALEPEWEARLDRKQYGSVIQNEVLARSGTSG
jgi:hypothetical protein